MKLGKVIIALVVIVCLPGNFAPCSKDFSLVLNWSGWNRLPTRPRVKTIPPLTTNPQFKDLIRFFSRGKLKRIDKLLKRYLKYGGFNGNVLIAHRGVSLYNKSFGLADFKEKTKLSADSVFQLASVTKQFTAMAIMILQEKGKLDYDDSVSRFINSFPYEKITIRHLLNHTGGLPNYMWLLEKYYKKLRAPYNDDVLKLLKEKKLPLYFKPGTRFNYSNTGYVVLASVIEKVSHYKFSEFIKKYIFKPLKMDQSFVYNKSDQEKAVNRVNGYYKKRGRYRIKKETLIDGIAGDKGIYSTTADLLRWDKALYTNKLVARDTLKEAFTKLTLQNRYRWHYGFGFRIRERGENKTVFHFGKWNSFNTCLARDLHSKRTIILLSNAGSNVRVLFNQIQQILSSPSFFYEISVMP